MPHLDDEDIDAYLRYPQYRKYTNKLYIAELFGYKCGPAGVPVPHEGKYVVRPIMNLAGMSVGARVVTIKPEEIQKVPAGYFWVEYFEGKQLSVDYVKDNGKWKLLNAYEGRRDENNLVRFTKWIKQYYQVIPLPIELQKIDLDKLNVEMIVTDDHKHNIFEVHLRNGFEDMMEYSELIPVFKGETKRREGYKFVEKKADGFGELLYPREGYLVR